MRKPWAIRIEPNKPSIIGFLFFLYLHLYILGLQLVTLTISQRPRSVVLITQVIRHSGSSLCNNLDVDKIKENSETHSLYLLLVLIRLISKKMLYHKCWMKTKEKERKNIVLFFWRNRHILPTPHQRDWWVDSTLALQHGFWNLTKAV